MNFWVDPLASSAPISGRCLSSLLLPGPFDCPTGRPEARLARRASFVRAEINPRSISGRCRIRVKTGQKGFFGSHRIRFVMSPTRPRLALFSIFPTFFFCLDWTSSKLTHRSRGQFQHARRLRFLGREASGYDRRSSPQKAGQNHHRKLGVDPQSQWSRSPSPRLPSLSESIRVKVIQTERN